MKILLSLVFTVFLFAQNAQINGNVSCKETKQKLPGANIVVKNTKISCASDMNANFKLDKLSVGKYIIQCSYLGYESVSDTIIVKKNDNLIVNFKLKRDKTKEIKVIEKNKNNFEFLGKDKDSKSK